jgi:hypothetical protein
MDAEQTLAHLTAKLEKYRAKKAASKAIEGKRKQVKASSVSNDSAYVDDRYKASLDKKAAKELKARQVAEYKAQAKAARKQAKTQATYERQLKVLQYRQESRERKHKASSQPQPITPAISAFVESPDDTTCLCGGVCNLCVYEKRKKLFEYMLPNERQIKSALCRVVRKGHEMS